MTVRAVNLSDVDIETIIDRLDDAATMACNDDEIENYQRVAAILHVAAVAGRPAGRMSDTLALDQIARTLAGSTSAHDRLISIAGIVIETGRQLPPVAPDRAPSAH